MMDKKSAKRLGLLAGMRERDRAAAEESAILEKAAHGMAYTRAERHSVIEQMLKLRPQWSNNRLADALGVSKNTVEGVRQELEAAGQIERLNELTGSDGSAYPRTQTPRKQTVLAPSGASGMQGKGKAAPKAKKPATPHPTKPKAKK